jgi:hypothetical protein
LKPTQPGGLGTLAEATSPRTDHQTNGDQHVSGTISGSPEGSSGRCTPTMKLRQACDADLRAKQPEIRFVAGAVLVGNPMPDPYAVRDQFHGVLNQARDYLRGQPSPRSVRNAGVRLQRALTGVIDDVAKEAQHDAEA